MHRITYTQSFKKLAIEKFQAKEDIKAFFESHGYDISEKIKNDKKYLSKLFYKWKKELRAKKILIKKPIKNDNEKDIILDYYTDIHIKEKLKKIKGNTSS